MRGRGLAAALVAGGFLAGGCGTGDGGHAVDPALGDGPITASASARGLTAGLLAHLDRDDVTSYGGEHDGPFMGQESWLASAQLEGRIRSVDIFVETLPEPFDPGCDPDGQDSTVLSCTTSPNGAKRSLMLRDTGGDAREPLLEGRTTRADGTWCLVQLWTDDATDDAKDLVLELLDDEALGARTTQGLNEAGAGLEDYELLKLEATLEDGAS